MDILKEEVGRCAALCNDNASEFKRLTSQQVHLQRCPCLDKWRGRQIVWNRSERCVLQFLYL